MNFHVGQKVVCVDDKIPCRSLANGSIYTIRWFGLHVDPHFGTNLCVRLAEINPRPEESELLKDYPEALADVPYYASRFRPLVTRKTDISIFKRMLTPNQEKVRA